MDSTAPREVLLVEECDDLREILCEVLGARGYHVRGFASLADALQAPARALHAILLAMNGCIPAPRQDLEAALRDAQVPDAPVVALVSGQTPAQLTGVTLALRKPVDEEQLCAALERCALLERRASQAPAC